MIFDTHTHLNVDHFKGQVDQSLELAKSLGVTRMAVVGFDYPTIQESLRLSAAYPQIVSIVGWHPTQAYEYDDKAEAYLLEALAQPKVVAMGEMGLDYYWKDSTPQDQDKVFRRQIAIAKELKLPIVIHNRDATQDVYKILKEEDISSIGGIMHSFNGGPEEGKQFLDLGMHLSFSGVLTYKKAQEVRDCLAIVPANRYLLETDAPYLAPVPYRGKPNEPAYTHYVAQMAAQVRGVTLEQVAQESYANAMKLFGLED